MNLNIYSSFYSLIEHINNNDIKKYEFFVTTYDKNNINLITDENNNTLLHYIIKNKKYEYLKKMIDLDFFIDLDSVNNNNESVLDIVIKNKDKDLIKLLITKIISKNIGDTNNKNVKLEKDIKIIEEYYIKTINEIENRKELLINENYDLKNEVRRLREKIELKEKLNNKLQFEIENLNKDKEHMKINIENEKRNINIRERNLKVLSQHFKNINKNY